jgi:hypothetical protein
LKSSGEKWKGQTPKEFINTCYVASRDQYATFKTPSLPFLHILQHDAVPQKQLVHHHLKRFQTYPPHIGLGIETDAFQSGGILKRRIDNSHKIDNFLVGNYVSKTSLQKTKYQQ